LPFLTFYGGVGEIGGNKILLEDKDVRIWLDFGRPFNYGSKYFVDWLTPRRIMGCKDHFEFGLLPRIKGLYGDDMLSETDLKYQKPEFDGIVLSHAHVDHVTHIPFVDASIPIHLGTATKTFIECQETSSSGDYGKHEYSLFRTGDKIHLGHLEIEPIHVDHSIPSAYGFIIHTSRGAIAYTGDMRLHGPKAKMTEEFVEKACEAEPVAMISEGTRVAPNDSRQNVSEEQVLQGVTKIAGESRGLVLASSTTRDVDRIKTFHEAAKNVGRELVLPPRIALLISRLARHMAVPDVSEDNVHVLFKRKRSGTYDDSDYYRWERPFLDRMITPSDVHRRQTRYLVHLPLYDFAEMIDIQPEPGSDFIHSQSEPFTEEDVNWDVMHNWLKHFHLNFHQIHASGHASKDAISRIICKIQPKKVMPVHTEHPEIFNSISGTSNVQLPKLGSKLQVET
jgi:ribonuclease J